MEAKYFENHLRGYKVVLAILRAESEDDSCRSCIGLEGAKIKVEKGLKKLKLDLADSMASEQDRQNITSQIDQLSQLVESVPLGEAPTWQKTTGLCMIGPKCLPLDGMTELMSQINQ